MKKIFCFKKVRKLSVVNGDGGGVDDDDGWISFATFFALIFIFI